MKSPVRVLVVEDMENDAELALRELRRAGLDCVSSRVDTEEAFRRGLSEFRPHVILSDFSMPAFHGMAALAIARDSHPDIPFIIVSGTLGEEYAIRALKSGATDYVLKTNLLRLPVAVGRALGDARGASARRQADWSAHEGETRFQATFDHAAVGIAHVDRLGGIIMANRRLAEMLGYGEGELIGCMTDELAHPDDRVLTEALHHDLRAGRVQTFSKEKRYLRKDGSLAWVALTVSVVSDPGGAVRYEIHVFHDISERKRAEQLQQLLQAALHHLTLARDAQDGLRAVLRAVCELEGWDVGRYFRFEPERATFCFADAWGIDRQPVRRFIEESAGVEFTPNIGSTGRTGGSEGLVWISDVLSAPETIPGLTVAPGGRSAFISPVTGGEGIVGMLGFSSRQVRHMDEGLLRIMRVIGGHLGAFLSRQDEQRRLEQLSRAHAMRSRVNAAALRLQTREELLRETCQVAVTTGGFPVAWLARPAGRDAVLAAFASPGAHVLPMINAVLARLREGAASGPLIVHDVARDARFANLPGGDTYRCLAVLPIEGPDQSDSAWLGLHGDAPNFPADRHGLHVLTEMAGDVGFALHRIGAARSAERLACEDPLTGLTSRTLFCDRVEQVVHTAQGAASRLAMVVIDIERFAGLNETFGRAACDALLGKVGARMRLHASDEVQPTRLYADRFAVLLRAVASAEDAARRVERLLDAYFKPPYFIDAAEVRLAARAGLAIFPEDGTDADGLLKSASAALERAKASQERYLFSTPGMSIRAAERIALEQQLRLAIERHEFFLCYQPKVDTRTRRVVGAEALIRWRNPIGARVPTLEFVELLEAAGLNVEVGAWAIRQALRERAVWLEQGLAAPRVTVNVSGSQFRSTSFVDTVREATAELGAAHGLDLELSEKLLCLDLADNVARIKPLRALDVRIAVDDFGTGDASLHDLARLPVHSLNIDRTLIAAMLTEPETMALVSSIVALARDLRMEVVAEGVETEPQAEALEMLRCRTIQGFLISKPLPADEFGRLLLHSAATP